MNWISVKDRLPLCSGRYLAFIPYYYHEGSGEVVICYFDGTNTWYDNDCVKTFREGDVTHWMPLPEPPMII